MAAADHRLVALAVGTGTGRAAMILQTVSSSASATAIGTGCACKGIRQCRRVAYASSLRECGGQKLAAPRVHGHVPGEVSKTLTLILRHNAALLGGGHGRQPFHPAGKRLLALIVGVFGLFCLLCSSSRSRRPSSALPDGPCELDGPCKVDGPCKLGSTALASSTALACSTALASSTVLARFGGPLQAHLCLRGIS